MNSHRTVKRNFDATKRLIRLSAGSGQRGAAEVAEKYHTTLVAPFCFSIIRDFFDDAWR